MEKNKKQTTLEDNFRELDQMLNEMERSDITLEESFALYQKGMDLIRQCNEKIDVIEKKMKIMNEEGELVDFQ